MKKALSIFIFFLFVLIISRANAEAYKSPLEATSSVVEEIIENKYGIKLSEMPSNICGHSGILKRMTIDYSQLSAKERKKIIFWEKELKDEPSKRKVISNSFLLQNQELNKDN